MKVQSQVIRIGLFFAIVALIFSASSTFATQPPENNPISVSQGWYPKSIALVIGIDKYSDGWPSLSNAVSDANRVIEELEHQGFVVYTLQNERATKSEILRFLSVVIPPRIFAADRFLFYFAGHGQTEIAPKGQSGFLIPSDGRKMGSNDQFYTYLSVQEIKNVLMEKYRAKHSMVVTDACLSGLAIGRSGHSPHSIQSSLRLKGQTILTAGGRGEMAQDGLFTSIFVQGLSGYADTNTDGYISFGELAQYSRNRVSGRSSGRQNPNYGWWEGQGEMIFRPTPKPKVTEVAPASTISQPAPIPINPESQRKLTKQMIKETIAKNWGRVKICIGWAKKQNPNLTGKCVIQFKIMPNGRVSTPKILSSTLNDPKTEQCLSNRLEAMKFPEFDGTPKTVTYPFVVVK